MFKRTAILALVLASTFVLCAIAAAQEPAQPAASAATAPAGAPAPVPAPFPAAVPALTAPNLLLPQRVGRSGHVSWSAQEHHDRDEGAGNIQDQAAETA
jgi:hypothetical protein